VKRKAATEGASDGDHSPEPPVRKARKSPSVKEEEEVPKKSPSKSPPAKVMIEACSSWFQGGKDL